MKSDGSTGILASRRRASQRAKRVMDVSVASAALVVLAPAMAVIAIAIRHTMGSPILFRQVRPGHLGKPFELIKFRSMLPETAPDGHPLVLSERLTRLGYLLRRSSLDELPELWNVLKGDMSLVGPRPLLLEYLPRYTPEQARRHEVKPGITGLAQVSGRHMIPWEERFRLDVWYVDNWTLGEDLRIMLATVRMASKGQGVPDSKSANWEFLGTPSNDQGDAGTADAGPDHGQAEH